MGNHCCNKMSSSRNSSNSKLDSKLDSMKFEPRHNLPHSMRGNLHFRLVTGIYFRFQSEFYFRSHFYIRDSGGTTASPCA